MQKFMEKFNNETAEYRKQRVYLEERIEYRNRQIERLQKRIDNLNRPHWHDVLNDIGEYICGQTGYDYEILGPFGMRAESSLWIVDKTKDRRNALSQYIIWSISVCPHFNDDGMYLTYDTGKKTGDYHPNSIGALNGFDNIEEMLPDTIEQVFELMKTLKEKEM